LRSRENLSEPGEPAAHRLLRQAQESVYRFPQGFGGFTATLYYAWDAECRAGTVEVRSPSDIRITGSISGDARIRRELTSIVSHHWPLAYEDSAGRHRLSLEPGEHPLGVLVRVEDDGMDSAYRIQGGQIQQIERRLGGRRVSTNIQERLHTADGRALPIHFCAVHWEAARETESRVIRTDIYRDGYISVDGVYLPLSRRKLTAEDSGTSIWRFLLRNHRLLDGAQAGNAAVESVSS